MADSENRNLIPSEREPNSLSYTNESYNIHPPEDSGSHHIRPEYINHDLHPSGEITHNQPESDAHTGEYQPNSGDLETPHLNSTIGTSPHSSLGSSDVHSTLGTSYAHSTLGTTHAHPAPHPHTPAVTHPHTPAVTHPHSAPGPSYPLLHKHRPVNVNTLKRNMSIAKGFMDISLLTANANQLKSLLKYGDSETYVYHLLLTLLSFSLILQIITGVMLILKERFDLNVEKHHKPADLYNNITTLLVLLTLLLNVFISSFGVSVVKHDQHHYDVKQQSGGPSYS